MVPRLGLRQPPTVAILVGGLGTRLRPVLADRPKCLAPIAGRPFLTHLLDRLADAGFAEVILCTGHLASLITDTYGSNYRTLQLHYSCETTPQGTGGALCTALPLIRSNRVLVMNGDSFIDLDLASFVHAHETDRSPASLVLRHVDDTRRYGRVTVDAQGRVQEFLEKSVLFRSGWINAGIYLIDRALLAAAPEKRPLSLERDLLPEWIAGGIHGFPSAGRFIDIGTPDDFARADAFFADLPRLAP